MAQKDIYLPILEEFCKKNEEALKTSGYPWCPFIPVTYENYQEGPKIFYMGIDTYYWGVSSQELLDAFLKNSLDSILEKNNKVVTPERVLEDWKNDKGLFWSFICKLHIFIRTGRLCSNEDLRHLSFTEQQLIEELGYGNMNSIELKKTLEKEDYWNSINAEKYWELKESSETLIDPLTNLIKAYMPDYIFILGWGGNEAHVFKGMKYTAKENFYYENYRAVYEFKDFPTKVIWSSHPSRFSFLGTNQEDMVEYLADTYKKIKG